MIWLVPSALAGSVAGFTVPGVGGGFSGPTEHGALGVISAPTAAVLGDDPELALDLGLLENRLTIALDGQERYEDLDRSPQPTLMLAVPLGKLGFGAAVQVPYLRGADEPPDTVLRLYSVSSLVQFVEEDLVAAVRPHAWFAGRAAARQFTYLGSKAVDSGALLNASFDPEPPLPLGEPLLQGHRDVSRGTTFSVSWVVGATLTVPEGPELIVSFRPPWATHGDHRITFVPSDDLAASIEGDVAIEVVMPGQLDVAGRIPVGPVVIRPEVQWVGWARTGRLGAEVSGLALQSSDPVLDGILGASGLDQADFVTSQEGELPSDLGWRDVLNLGLQASVAVDPVELRVGVWRAPKAIPDRTVTPANVDFARWDLRAGAAWQVARPLRVALSADVYPGSVRNIRDSVYTVVDPPPGADPIPSANGRYALGLWRAGLTVVVAVPTEER